MSLIDFLIIIVLTIFVAFGSKKGMIAEILGLTGWAVAVLVALRFMGKAGAIMHRFAGGKFHEAIFIILGFFIILFGVRLAFQALTATFQKIFSQDTVTKVNKIGGAVFGFLEGAL